MPTRKKRGKKVKLAARHSKRSIDETAAVSTPSTAVYSKSRSIFNQYKTRWSTDSLPKIVHSHTVATSTKLREMYKEIEEEQFLMAGHSQFGKYFEPRRIAWSTLRLILITYYMTIIPLRLCFFGDSFHASLWFDWTVDMFFVVDTVLQLSVFSVLYVEGGAIKQAATRQSIYAHITQHPWMWCAIIATIPYDIGFWALGWRALNAVRCVKLLHMGQITGTIAYLSGSHSLFEVRMSTITLRIVRIGFEMLVIAHWAACFWFYLGEYEYDNGNGNCWFLSKGSESRPLVERSVNRQYLISFYWSVVTIMSIGYGDYTPQQETEMAFAICLCLFGWTALGRIIGNLAPLMHQQTAPKAAFMRKMEQLQSYMRVEKVDSSVKKEVIRHFQNEWDRFYGVPEDDIFTYDLPPRYRQDVGMFLIGSTLRRVPFLKRASEDFLRHLILGIRFEHVARHYEFQRQGAPCKAFYIVLHGEIEEFADDSVRAIHNAKCAVGYEYIFNEGTPSPVSYFAASPVDLVVVPRAQLFRQLQNMPAADRDAILEDMRTVDAKFRGDAQLPPMLPEDKSKKSLVKVSAGRGTIKPDHQFRAIWDLFSFVFVVYYALIIPFRITFWRKDWETIQSVDWVWFSIDWVVDGFFVIDIYLHIFHFALANPYNRNLPIMSHTIFSTHYLKGDFKWDMLAAVPLDVIEMLGRRRNAWLLFARLNKLLRMHRFGEYYQNFSNWAKRKIGTRSKAVLASDSAMALLRILAFALVVVHWVGCLWFLLSEWQHRDEGETTTWVSEAGITLETFRSSRYIRSVYWAMVTASSIGYGDIVPHTSLETIFAVLVITTTAWMYIYVLGKLTTFAENLNEAAHEFENSMLVVARYSRECELPKSVFFRVSDYREFKWALQRGANPRHPLYDFPTSLQARLVHSICSGNVQKLLPFEVQEDRNLIMAICSLLEPQIHPPLDSVCGPDSLFVTKLYILVTGEVRAYDPNAANDALVSRDSQGSVYSGKRESASVPEFFPRSADDSKHFRVEEQSMFGLEALSSAEKPRYKWRYEAHTTCSCFVLNVGDLMGVLEKYRHRLKVKLSVHFDKVAEGGIMVPGESATRALRRRSIDLTDGQAGGDSAGPMNPETPRTRERKALSVRFSNADVVYDDETAHEPIRMDTVTKAPPPTPSSRVVNQEIQRHNKQFRFVWEAIKVGGFVYFFVIVPLRIGFVFDISWSNELLIVSMCMDFIVDLIFLADIFYFRRKVFVEMVDGELISPKKAWAQYRSSPDFKWDVTSTLVFDNLLLFWNVRVVFWLRLLRLFRLHRFNQGYRALEKYVGTMAESQNLRSATDGSSSVAAAGADVSAMPTTRRGYFSPALLRITRQLIILLGYVHFIGCFWYLVARTNDNDSESWIRKKVGSTKAERYLESFYFVVTSISTVGFGDISPSTIDETYFSIGLMLTGLVLWAVFTANVASLVANYDAVESAYKEKIEAMMAYLSLHVESESVKYKVREYMNMIWSRYRGVEPNVTLKNMPKSLLNEAAYHQFGPYMNSLAIFNGCDEKFLAALAGRMEYASYLEPWYSREQALVPIKVYDFITKVGEAHDFMVVVVSGKLEFTDATGSTVMDTIEIESVADGTAVPFAIDEMNLITGIPQRSTFNIRAASACEAIVLHHADVVAVLDEYPSQRQRLVENIKNECARKREKAMRGQLQSEEHSAQVVDRVKTSSSMRMTAFRGRFIDDSTERGQKFRQWWDLAAFVALMFYLITSPANAVFRGAENLAKFWLLIGFSILVDVFMFVDLYYRMMLFIPMNTPKSQLPRTPAEVRQLYFRKRGRRVYLDWLGMLPIDWVAIAVAFAADIHTDNMQNWIGFWRLNRMLLGHRYTTYLKYLEQHAAVNRKALFQFISRRMGKLILVLILGLHWLACAWFILGDKSDSPTWFEKKGGGAADASPFGQYIYSLYFVVSMATTVGYGDIAPTNSQEMLFFLVAIVIGDVLYADIIGSMSMRVTTRTAEDSKHTYRMTYLSQYMRFRRLPIDLRNKVLAWHEHVYRLGSGMRSPVYMLPTHLARRVLYAINYRALDAMPYMREAVTDDNNFLKTLTSLMYRRMFVKGDCVFSQGTVSDEIVFILSGQVQVYLPFDEDGNVVAATPTFMAPRLGRRPSAGSLLGVNGVAFENDPSLYVESHHESLSPNDADLVDQWQMMGKNPIRLSENEVIGDMGFFSGDLRSGTVIARQTVDALSLNRHEFRQLLHLYPHHKANIVNAFVRFAAEKQWIYASDDDDAMDRLNAKITENLSLMNTGVGMHTEQMKFLVSKKSPLAVHFTRAVRGTLVDLSTNTSMDRGDDDDEKDDYDY